MIKNPNLHIVSSENLALPVTLSQKTQPGFFYTKKNCRNTTKDTISFKVSFWYTHRKDFKQRQKTMKFIRKRQRKYYKEKKSIWNKFTPYISIRSQNRNTCSFPIFLIQKEISKKLEPFRKVPYWNLEKHTSVNYNLIDSNKKGLIQH